jgi:alpha-beta hydrolase superfamily lysophospholipase
LIGFRNVDVTHHMVDVGRTVPNLAGLHVAADLFVPRGEIVHPAVFCCLSGGGVSRAYWDLSVSGDQTYSFARWMAGHGFPVITVDHLGTGESLLPADMPAPLLGQVVAANDAAFRALCTELRLGGTGADPILGLHPVGVGHSMGATLTIRQQAAHCTYDAVALLGFDMAGLPEQLPSDVLAASADGPPEDHKLAELTQRMFGTAYAWLPGSGTARPGFHDERVSNGVHRAVDATATRLLGAGGLLSMLPGNVATDAAWLTVPILVLNGERDPLISRGRADAAQYPAAAKFTSRVIADAGHNHNISASRLRFWEDLRHWAESVIPT